MKEQLRPSILARDDYCCCSCGASENLEIHHYVTKEEGRQIGASEDLLDHPANLITLCQTCHSLIYVGVPRWLFTKEEKDELRHIQAKRQQLSQARQELKGKYHNLWDTAAYQYEKQKIDRSLKELHERGRQLRKAAEGRSISERREILDKLKDIVSKG